MNLNTENWKEFKLSNLFDISAGKYHYSDEYGIGDTPYVSASNSNNGIGQKINLSPDFSGNCIVTGKVGCTAFYQPESFCATSDVNVMIPKGFILNDKIGLFIVTIINKSENYKWCYGRQCRVGDSKEISIKLPIKTDSDGNPIIDNTKQFSKKGYIPDWKYMEDYIASLNSKPVTTDVKKSANKKLDTSSWKEYTLGDLFSIEKGKRLTKADMIEGNTNFLGAIDSNNGVRQKIDTDVFWKPNCITVNYNGSVGEAFYQSEPFWASDDVNILYPKGWRLNEYIGLFIATIIKAERPKYNYGRKWTKSIMEKSIIKLPSINDKPDWDFMENYIKTLQYSDRIGGFDYV